MGTKDVGWLQTDTIYIRDWEDVGLNVDSNT